MQSSDSIKEVMGKIASVSFEMGRIEKKSNNPFFKSKYAKLEVIQEALAPKLEKYKVGVSQPLFESGIATLVTDLESGEWIMFPASINSASTKPQDQMSGVTYMKRYGLVGVFNLEVGDEDDDGNAVSRSPRVEEAPPEELEEDNLDF